MSRILAGAVIGLAIGGAWIGARADDPPPLTAPADAAPSPAPVELPPLAPQITARRPEPTAENRPVLAIPGLNAPRGGTAKPTARPSTPPPSLSPDQTDALPPLVSPLSRPSVRIESDPLPGLPSRRFSPRVIESMPKIDEPIVDPKSSRTSPLESSPLPTRREGAPPRGFDEATNYRSRMLNRLMPSRTPTEPPSESSITTEPRSDPAADAALKRRIEKQINEAVGSRVKKVEVRVIGRVVTIQASGVRFLQKRAVRRSIEGLPALSGYKAVIDVND